MLVKFACKTPQALHTRLRPACALPALFPEQLDWPDGSLTLRGLHWIKKVHAASAQSSHSLDARPPLLYSGGLCNFLGP